MWKPNAKTVRHLVASVATTGAALAVAGTLVGTASAAPIMGTSGTSSTTTTTTTTTTGTAATVDLTVTPPTACYVEDVWPEIPTSITNGLVAQVVEFSIYDEADGSFLIEDSPIVMAANETIQVTYGDQMFFGHNYTFTLVGVTGGRDSASFKVPGWCTVTSTTTTTTTTTGTSTTGTSTSSSTSSSSSTSPSSSSSSSTSPSTAKATSKSKSTSTKASSGATRPAAGPGDLDDGTVAMAPMAYHSNGSWAFWGITITFALVLLLGYLAYKLRDRKSVV